MAHYPHLKLPYRIEGLAKPGHGGGPKPLPQTLANKENRQNHGTALLNQLDNIRNTWQEFIRLKAEGQSALPDVIEIPIFLKIDPNTFPEPSTFKNWGVEIISQEADGFLLGVTRDGFAQFESNLRQFLAEHGRYKDTAAKIWEIADNQGRIMQLLKGDLKNIWGDVADEQVYTIEMGIHCYVENDMEYPDKSEYNNESVYEEAVAEFTENETLLVQQRDLLQIKREEEIVSYVSRYQAAIHDEWDNQCDAIFFKISIKGNGLRDLVFTYPFLFKVSLPAGYQTADAGTPLSINNELQIVAPTEDSPVVCIIDSGIQQNHQLLAAAINQSESISYVTGDNDPSDLVRNAGHGTQVAGATLYPRQIPIRGSYQLAHRLQNAKILDRNNLISDEQFGPALMNKIVVQFPLTRIFNMSVSEKVAYDSSHMHELAGSIDKLMHEKNILFILPAGNLYISTGSGVNPGINEFIQSGNLYPDYLNDERCKIANPGISSFALTVGSVGYNDFDDADNKALAGTNKVSPFSRTGLGMWGGIKPDVVEYGGDLIINKLSQRVSANQETSIELVNSTLYNAGAHGKESQGTSFSAPKVSHIAAALQKEHPNETAQMYRALIVQSARLPQHCFNAPLTAHFARYGYGIPDLNRALNNVANRITFIQQGELGGKKADIYKLVIPEELRGEGKNFSVLVEITLAFTARTRITRKGAHSYISTWLEWQSSKNRENFSNFRSRILEYLDDGSDEEVNMETGDNPIKWVLRGNPKWSPGIDINLKNSTVQKSWAVIQPYQFTDDFSIAVIGHNGFDKNPEIKINYALTVSFEASQAQVPVYQLMSEVQLPSIQSEVEIEV